MTAHPTILSRILGLFGRRDDEDFNRNPKHEGDRDGALNLSEEPTTEEIVRVAADKNDPHLKDS